MTNFYRLTAPARLPVPQASRTSVPCLIRAPSPWVSVRTDWLEQAAKLPGKSLHVGLAIWNSAARSGCSRVILFRRDRELFGVSREACYDALTRLSAARLLQVDRHRGRCPVVRLLGRSGEPLVLVGGPAARTA